MSHLLPFVILNIVLVLCFFILPRQFGVKIVYPEIDWSDAETGAELSSLQLPLQHLMKHHSHMAGNDIPVCWLRTQSVLRPFLKNNSRLMLKFLDISLGMCAYMDRGSTLSYAQPRKCHVG